MWLLLEAQDSSVVLSINWPLSGSTYRLSDDERYGRLHIKLRLHLYPIYTTNSRQAQGTFTIKLDVKEGHYAGTESVEVSAFPFR